MDVEGAREFLRHQHHAVLATRRADGTPQLSPVLATVDDGGCVIVSTSNRSVKVHNLRRDPRAYLCVLPDRFFGDWVSVEGPVEIVDLPDAMPLLVDYYRRISGEHPDWVDYETAMTREQRVLLRVSIERAGPA